jgi:hypothetical protein
MVFIGWWVSILWFLIGYFLVAIVVTKQTGFWFFQRMGFIFSLQEPLEREIIFHRKIVTYIWFYLFGWFIGPCVVLLALLLSLTIIFFKYGESMASGLDLFVIAA